MVTIRYSLVAIALAWASFVGLAERAQADAADVYYSRGVQAFFDGRYERAEAYFDRAVQYRSSEPRMYYFRGLSRNEQGETVEAETDLRQGAVIEAELNRVYRIGGALKSVTGDSKQLLDRIRTEMLSDLPVYADGDGLPSGSRRAAQALHSKFEFSLSLIDTVERPEQLAAMIEAKRPKTLEQGLALPPPPVVVEYVLPEDARGTMTGAKMGSVINRLFGFATGSAKNLAIKVTGGNSGGFGGPMDDGDPFGDDPGFDSPGGGDDPFGTGEGGDDPFGAPAGDDPFGAPPEDNGDPFADDPSDDDPMSEANPDDDPFGGGIDSGDGPAGFDVEEGGADTMDPDDPFGDDPFGG